MTRRRRRRFRKEPHQTAHVVKLAPAHRSPRQTGLAADDGLGDIYLQMAIHAASLVALGLQAHRIYKHRKQEPDE